MTTKCTACATNSQHRMSLVGAIAPGGSPGLVARLVGAGVGIYRVAPQEPSLEDVYFAIHGESGESPLPGEEGLS